MHHRLLLLSVLPSCRLHGRRLQARAQSPKKELARFLFASSAATLPEHVAGVRPRSTITLSPTPSLEELNKALGCCRVPSREALEILTKKFVYGRVMRAFGGKFRFLHSGSLYMKDLEFAVDLDVLLRSEYDVLQVCDAETLFSLAKKSFIGIPRSVRTADEEGKNSIEVKWSEFRLEQFCKGDSSPQHRTSLPFACLVVTGLFRTTKDGWVVPMDIAISCEKRGAKENDASRLGKISKKMQERDYAKVLQKVRSFLRRNQETLLIRDWLCASINADIGKLRFVAKQLALPCKAAYLERTLGLGGLQDRAVREAWEEFMQTELQNRALLILSKLRAKLDNCTARQDWIPRFLHTTLLNEDAHVFGN